MEKKSQLTFICFRGVGIPPTTYTFVKCGISHESASLNFTNRCTWILTAFHNLRRSCTRERWGRWISAPRWQKFWLRLRSKQSESRQLEVWPSYVRHELKVGWYTHNWGLVISSLSVHYHYVEEGSTATNQSTSTCWMRYGICDCSDWIHINTMVQHSFHSLVSMR